MTSPAAGTRQAPGKPPAVGLRLDRIVVGLLLAAGGVGWLLDEAGVSVPWRMFPAAALILVGLTLIATLAGGRGRPGLVGLGAVLLVVAAAVGIGVDRFAGPTASDRLITPATETWPAVVRHSAGNLTVDLSRDTLPPSGRMEVHLGAGRVVVTVPGDPMIRIDAQVVTGNIRVDGVNVSDGIDARWVEPDTSSAPIVVTIYVGVGEIEVNHE